MPNRRLGPLLYSAKIARKVRAMSQYLSDKGIVVQRSKNRINFSDPVGSMLVYQTRRSLELDCQHYVNLKPCFLSVEKSDDLYCAEWSTVLDMKSNLTAESYVEQVLDLCREIEYLVAQLAYGAIFNEAVLGDYIGFDEKRWLMIDEGHWDTETYSKWLATIRSSNSHMANALVAHSNIRKLCDSIRFGIAQSDYRLLGATESAAGMVQKWAKEFEFVESKELVERSPKADLIGWEINDCVKSLVTTLDALSKAGFYCSKMALKEGQKVPGNRLVTNLPHLKFPSKSIDESIFYLYKKLKPLVSLRNELTHNQNIYGRLPVFVGKNTPRVNGKNICYCDVVLWDVDGGAFSRAEGTLGFFSQHSNAIAELHSYFVYTYQMIALVLQLSLEHLKSLAKGHGFTEFVLLTDARTRQFSVVAL